MKNDSGSGVHPPLDWPDYKSTRLRAPHRAPVPLSPTETELTGPEPHADEAHDLTAGEPQGQRIIIHGRVLNTAGRPVAGSLVEIWQATAAGRYRHEADRTPAPLDPNFTGDGRCLTDADGWYRFVTVRPGAYPWGNHDNAWRPAHVHFSLLGRAFADRLVTQMYFPDDPLFAYDPIFNAVRDAAVRERLIAQLDLDHTIPERALAFRFDIALGETPSQTVGPFFAIALKHVDAAAEGITISGRVLDGAGDPVPDALVETWHPDAGFGRCPTDGDGRWSIVTRRAPHLAVSLFARGLLNRVVTRIYFADEAEANAADPVLQQLPGDAARATLIAQPAEGGYALDLHLQGERETVFFALA